MKKLTLLLSLLVLALGARAETYTIDPVHSSVGFNIRHVVSRFSSNFTKLTGTISYDSAAPDKSVVDVTVEIGSINTANEKRNTHLLSADFFDAAKFPSATFKSTAWTKTGADTFDVAGDLTIKGVAKPVVLKVTLLATGPGRGGSTVSGWTAALKISKADFGISGPAMLGKALGDEVTLDISVEAGTPPAAK